MLTRRSGFCGPYAATLQRTQMIGRTCSLKCAAFSLRMTLLCHSRVHAGPLAWSGPQVTAFRQLTLRSHSERLAVAQWRAGDLAGACDTLDSLVQRMLETGRDTQQKKSLWVAVHRLARYLSTLGTVSGSQYRAMNDPALGAPCPGMFRHRGSGTADQYCSVFDCLLPIHWPDLLTISVSADSALVWARMSVGLARETGSATAVVAVGELAVTHLILADRNAEALQLATDVAVTQQAVTAENRFGDNTFSYSDAIAAINKSDLANLYRKSIEHHAAKLALIPAFIRSATAGIESDNGRSGERYLAIEDLCRKTELSAKDPQFWKDAADVISKRDGSMASVPDVRERVASRSLSPEIALLELISAPLWPGCGPVEALGAHISAFYSLFRWFSADSVMCHRVLTPFLAAYWSRVTARKRMLFTAPWLVDRALNDALSGSVNHRGPAILNAVRLGLRVSVSKEIEDWLRQADVV